MNKKTIQLNNLTDIYNALELDLITPIQAILVSCKALKMISMISNNEALIKKQVLKQILHLDFIINSCSKVPIFFWQQSEDFKIEDVYNTN